MHKLNFGNTCTCIGMKCVSQVNKSEQIIEFSILRQSLRSWAESCTEYIVTVTEKSNVPRHYRHYLNDDQNNNYEDTCNYHILIIIRGSRKYS